MEYNTLYEKYQALIAENKTLKAENEILRARLGVTERRQSVPCQASHSNLALDLIVPESPEINPNKGLLSYTDPSEKIKLFMSLFRGRDDVYAKRWQSKEGKSGYAPVCLNEWKPGLCAKREVKCAHCSHKAYDILNEKIIEAHLRGNIIIGIYPMYKDETCHFLAIDFDKDGWHEDTSTFREVCSSFDIPVAVERSRSGNGAHAWFFFEDPISAILARKFGTALLTYTMSRRHEIPFKSYDRLFPNQDTLPDGGLGSLIALPLQKKAREQGNSVFIDENFTPYADQWGFLANVRKLTENDMAALIPSLCRGNELGILKQDDEEAERPWETNRIALSRHDFPEELTLVKANMIFVPKEGVSQKALNALKRLAAFKNPEFYKYQAMRKPTYNQPRVISCADETMKYLCLPRGCEIDIAGVLAEAGTEAAWSDKTNTGRRINVEFKGQLREEQQAAAEDMLKHEIGVLSATTAFGKTVIASIVIAERKVNTLILVHRQQLLVQWAARLAEFLEIDEPLPLGEKRRGRKKQQSLIGQIGAGNNNPSGIIDVTVMQSLNRSGDVKELVRDYGLVIVDECHHVPAISFEQILKSVRAKYVCGLTATPARRDGRHPIIFMHCGPIRFRVDARKQAEKRPFEHYVIPRFTRFFVPPKADEKEYSIQELYAEIATHELRNQLIADDVLRNYQNGRNSLVLTERTAHVELLAKKLKESIPDAITLVGGRGAKEKKEALSRISDRPADKQLTLIATGKYLGEGFDEPRLDTLFLAMPISWKGTLQQYAGRLHRLFEGKREVQIYDYIDIHVRMLEKMYQRRLTGYSSIGYRVKAESLAEESVNIIFNNHDFLPVFQNDLTKAVKEIVIVSPFVTKRRVHQMLPIMSAVSGSAVKLVVWTRPASDYKDKQACEEILGLLQAAGITLVFKSNIHQKYAVVDQRIVWFGSINLLSFGRSEECIMRLESPTIAHELMRSIEKEGKSDYRGEQ